MTGDELIAWQQAHGFTVERLAAALGVSRRTLYHWRSGGTAIPPFVSLALETLERRES